YHFGARYPTGQVRAAGGQAKSDKGKLHHQRTCLFWRTFGPRNTRMIRNEASAAAGSETSSTDRRHYFFLNFASFRMLRGPQCFIESRFLRKRRSRIQPSRPGSSTFADSPIR